MAINPIDTLGSLTNAKCAELRDDLVALLVASGVATPTVRNLKRRVRIGIDYIADRVDERAERDIVETSNLNRQLELAALQPIRDRRGARRQIDYGLD